METLFDPYTARDVEIAAPVPANIVFDGVTPIPHKGWMVCMHANAKDSFGAFTGLQVTGMLIEEDGEVGTVAPGPASLNRFSFDLGCRAGPRTEFPLRLLAVLVHLMTKHRNDHDQRADE